MDAETLKKRIERLVSMRNERVDSFALYNYEDYPESEEKVIEFLRKEIEYLTKEYEKKTKQNDLPIHN